MTNPSKEPAPRLRYSCSLIRQGHARFYTLSMPSEVLARTTFVTTRDEDPVEGFQRALDRTRAQQIADYIDGGGSIPNAIVLSAQGDAEIKDLGPGKTLEFRDTPRAFLILDGQHRVYGFRLARSNVRIPVVIYKDLTRVEESRLFMDINTKQRPVPNELLLDIKKLAEAETDVEQVLGSVYDRFATDPSSPLLGLLSPSARAPGLLSRVTFNNGVRPLLSVAFRTAPPDTIYELLSAYVRALAAGAAEHGGANALINPTLFRALMGIFPEVGQRVKDSFAGKYSTENFAVAVAPLFAKRPTWLTQPGTGARALRDKLSDLLRPTFTLD